MEKMYIEILVNYNYYFILLGLEFNQQGLYFRENFLFPRGFFHYLTFGCDFLDARFYNIIIFLQNLSI